VTKPIAGDDFANISVQDPDHLITGNLLANDSDPDGNSLFLRFVDGIRVGDKGVDTIQGTYGTFKFNADGTYTYTLDTTNPAVQALQHGQTLTESLNYKISDGLGGTDFGLFKLQIDGPNTRPVATDDHLVFDPTGITTITGNILANDTDADGDKLQVSFIGTGSPLEYIPNNGSTVTFEGEYGSLTVGRDGNYVYTPDESNAAVSGLSGNTVLTDHFVYKIWDGQDINSADQGDIYIDLSHHTA